MSKILLNFFYVKQKPDFIRENMYNRDMYNRERIK